MRKSIKLMSCLAIMMVPVLGMAPLLHAQTVGGDTMPPTAVPTNAVAPAMQAPQPGMAPLPPGMGQGPNGEHLNSEQRVERREFREEREAIRAEHEKLESEHDTLKARCMDSKGQEHAECKAEWQTLRERSEALHERVKVLHEKMEAAGIHPPQHSQMAGGLPDHPMMEHMPVPGGNAPPSVSVNPTIGNVPVTTPAQ